MGFVRPEGHGGKVLTVIYIAVGCITPCVPYRRGVFNKGARDDDVLSIEPCLSPVVFSIDAGDLEAPSIAVFVSDHQARLDV